MGYSRSLLIGDFLVGALFSWLFANWDATTGGITSNLFKYFIDIKYFYSGVKYIYPNFMMKLPPWFEAILMSSNSSCKHCSCQAVTMSSYFSDRSCDSLTISDDNFAEEHYPGNAFNLSKNNGIADN